MRTSKIFVLTDLFPVQVSIKLTIIKVYIPTNNIDTGMELRYFLAPAVGSETVSMGLDLVMEVVYNHPLPHADRFLYVDITARRVVGKFL